MRSFPVVAVVVVALALPSLGCKRLAEKAEEKAIERSTGGQVQINDGKGGGLKITTDAGTMMIGNGASIPDDFPKAVALYPGAKPILGAKQSDAKGKAVWTVSEETPDGKDKVVAYYKANMSGFTPTTTMDMGQSSMNVYDSPQYTVSLTIAAEGNKTGIQLTAATK
jgi:hypothetical protein